MQRYLIIGAGVVVIAGIAAVAYFFFFSGSPGGVVATTGSTFPTSGATGGAGGALGAGGGASASSSAPVVVPSSAQQIAARLVEIDKGPVVAGEAVFDTVSTTTGTTTKGVAVAFANRQSGNLFSFQWNTRTLTRTSNRTIPGVEEADWAANGSQVYLRYLSGADNATINTYALPANGGGGFFLPQNISDLAVALNSVLYLSSGANGTIGTLAKLSGASPAQAFTTPLSQIRAAFAGGNYLAYTAPSAAVPGYAFLVAGGSFMQIAGPLLGLVALPSPKGTYALISYASAGVMHMELVNIKTHAVLPLPVATIADKCAWSADESAIYCGIPSNPSANFAYPDDWYQGAVHFADRIWKISVSGRFAELLVDASSQSGVAIDAANLTLDPNQTLLVFRNKNDSSLWAYQL